MPHGAFIKLNRQPVRGINGAFIPILRPEVTPIIDPCPRWLADFIDEVEVPTVLRDEGKAGPAAILNALVRAGKRCDLCGSICCTAGHQCGGNSNQCHFHSCSPVDGNFQRLRRFDRNGGHKGMLSESRLEPVGVAETAVPLSGDNVPCWISFAWDRPRHRVLAVPPACVRSELHFVSSAVV